MVQLYFYCIALAFVQIDILVFHLCTNSEEIISEMFRAKKVKKKGEVFHALETLGAARRDGAGIKNLVHFCPQVTVQGTPFPAGTASV